MIAQNKKTGQRKEFTPQEWETIKQIGFSANWQIISGFEPIEEPKIIPIEITKFSEIKKPTKKKSHARRKDS